MTLFALLGYAGTLLYLVSHAYVSLKQDFNQRFYFGSNLVAASALVLSSLELYSWQAVCVNLFWALVSLQRLRGATLPACTALNVFFHKRARLIVVVALMLLIISLSLEPLMAISFLAWCSVLIFSLAYLLFAAGELDKHRYMWLSFLAAISILPQLWLDSNYPVLLLESCWAIVSIWGALGKRTVINDV